MPPCPIRALQSPWSITASEEMNDLRTNPTTAKGAGCLMISSITPTPSFLRQQQQQKTHRRARLAFLSAVAAAYTNAATAGQEACTTAESCRLRPAVMVPQHKPRSSVAVDAAAFPAAAIDATAASDCRVDATARPGCDALPADGVRRADSRRYRRGICPEHGHPP